MVDLFGSELWALKSNTVCVCRSNLSHAASLHLLAGTFGSADLIVDYNELY